MSIGVAIITCNRPDFFLQCYESIPAYVDKIVVINDGKPFTTEFTNQKDSSRLWLTQLIQNHPNNHQVGQCKNQAMQALLDAGCDYIFTMEDDIRIKDPQIFWKYIRASCSTGIQHMNFGFSQKENLDKDFKPVYRKEVEYPDGTTICLTPNILGAFTFYTRQALQTIGLHHHKFNKGHGDHPELTYRAYKHGFTTPFWWFTDIYGSWDMIENLSNMGSDSLVRNQEKFMQNFQEACSTFEELHGVNMLKVPDIGEDAVIQCLKNINENNHCREPIYRRFASRD